MARLSHGFTETPAQEAQAEPACSPPHTRALTRTGGLVTPVLAGHQPVATPGQGDALDGTAAAGKLARVAAQLCRAKAGGPEHAARLARSLGAPGAREACGAGGPEHVARLARGLGAPGLGRRVGQGREGPPGPRAQAERAATSTRVGA